MKRTFPMLFAFLSCLSFWSFSQNRKNGGGRNVVMMPDTSAKSVEGAWQLVWAEYDDKTADMNNRYLFKSFNDGVFSLITYDSTKKITFAGYGKYDFANGKYHETFIYHTNSAYIGGEDWQNLEVTGDTMYLNGIIKVIVGGKEMTAGWTKVKEKLVRVKWQEHNAKE